MILIQTGSKRKKSMTEFGITVNHWGVGRARVQDGNLLEVGSHPGDPTPSAINDNIASSLNGEARVRRPAVRKSWLDHGPEARVGERGRDPFVELDWDETLELLAAELERVRRQHGNEAIYAGSYGWSSAGRFHHAQSQMKRFLNAFGGFVRSEGNYSYNAALGLMPHVVKNYREMVVEATRWKVIAREVDLVVMFGGIPVRSTQVSDGGIGRHRAAADMQACARAGVRFVNLSPLRSDAAEELGAEWLPPRPGSDTAVMMGMAHLLLTEGLHDQDFLDRYTVGQEKVRACLMGQSDGVVKDIAWAASLSGLDATRLATLTREMAAGRTLITTTAGIQRADFGEQPLWMTVTLAAMLGQIGQAGGFGIGYGVNGSFGSSGRPYRAGSFSQGDNPVENFVPVAMVADALLCPGQTYDYAGMRMRFPDIRMVWWAGGNPFHHAQDLNRLRKAFQRPETVIVNELNWTSSARHADIVLPVAAAEERMDFAAGKYDPALLPMPAIAQPPGLAMTEFDIFAALERKMSDETRFSEGLSGDEWVMRLWDETRVEAAKHGDELPCWEDFIGGDIIDLEDPEPEQVFLADFRADPTASPLPTPSGLIELYSETIAGFGYEDCPGQASWIPPRGISNGDYKRFPLQMVSGQPATRLHSQLDNGDYSKSFKIQGREPVLIHPEDAQQRGIRDGDVVELFNDKGVCLAGARVTDEIMAGVVFLWTGAWYDPDFAAPRHRDRHGNPNVLTHDLRTSKLTQGPASHSAFVELCRFEGELPPISVHSQPEFVQRNPA